MAHLKRLAVPKNWAVRRKTTKWIAKPRAGPHPLARAIPLTVAVHEVLGLVDTARESRRVIGAGSVLVDNVPRKDPNFPLSYMDVVAVPKTNAFFRVLVDTHGRIHLQPSTKERAAWKLARVENKTTVKGGLTQLNMHDGRNLVVAKDKFHTGDTLKIEVPTQKVLEHFPLKEGHVALVIGGRHVGETGVVQKVEVLRGPYENLVHLKNSETGATFSTVKRYVFVVGGQKPEITIPRPAPNVPDAPSSPPPKPVARPAPAPKPAKAPRPAKEKAEAKPEPKPPADREGEAPAAAPPAKKEKGAAEAKPAKEPKTEKPAKAEKGDKGEKGEKAAKGEGKPAAKPDKKASKDGEA